MRVYLDLCCLKRPFDRQDSPRVRLESEAVLAILVAHSDRVTLLRTIAHLLENSFNPARARREAVHDWLSGGAVERSPGAWLTRRTEEMISLGFGSFDAFHLACAGAARADVFATCDRPLLQKARRLAARLPFRVTDPVTLAQEVSA